MSLAAQTAKAWFATLEAKRQRELARATYEDYRTSHELVRARYERGVRPSRDTRQSEADLASSQDRLHQREQLYDISIRQLEVLIGRYPAGTFAIAGDLPSVPHPVPAGPAGNSRFRRRTSLLLNADLPRLRPVTKPPNAHVIPRISLTAVGRQQHRRIGQIAQRGLRRVGA